tara:strand:+ start:1597 stop:1833 length:237 start_codon:yes stop_codon:yes gene_type:complete
MSKTGAYKVKLVQVIVRECYYHTKNRNGEEEAEIQVTDEYLNPIKDSDIIHRETVYNWDDISIKDTTETYDLGEDYDD